ncbi:MAG TPA: hypothetical protein PLK08_04930, partial [Phycisphaerae bacterium]|nr:hypothetical protein [Phycisphaerae bacterium]
MISIKEHVAGHRRSLRAATLVIVLFLCTGIAWLLVAYKSSDSKAAATILSEIRAGGLRKYLSSTRSETCHITVDADGRPLGWKVAYTQPGKNGGYSGGAIMSFNMPDGSAEIAVSRWELDKNATAGRYMSHVFVRDALPQEIDTTEII